MIAGLRDAWAWMLRVPIHPTAFAAAFVLNRYLQTGEYVLVVTRPLLVMLAIAAAAQLTIGGIARNRHVGAALATVLLATVLDPRVGLLLVVVILGPTLALAIRTRRLVRVDWRRITAILAPISVIAFLLTEGLAIARAVNGALPEGPPATPAAAHASSGSLPDIYVVLLDEYPRADTLARYGFDNSPFVEALESRGFQEAERSHSNYNATILTLSSMLNAEHVASLLGPDHRGPLYSWDLQPFVNQGVGLDWLRAAGYEVISLPSGITAEEVRSADRVIDTGQANTFEVSLLRAGVVPRIFPGEQARWLSDQHRDRVRAQLARLGDIAAERDAAGPRFIFDHIVSPHPPIVFDAQGGPTAPPACVPVTCNLWEGVAEPDVPAVLGQLAYLNTLVLEAVGSIQAQSEQPPVIVVMSDHGGRYDATDADEMIRNMFIASTPGRPDLFPPDVTPINLIPRLLNAYAGTELPLATEESYEADLRRVRPFGYLPLTPWPQR